MLKSKIEPHKDTAYIGSGIISLIDAACHNLSGRSVVIYEGSNFIGGVWAPVKLPGSNVESDYGVHYFLKSEKADIFFRRFYSSEYHLIDDQYEVTFIDDRFFSRTKRPSNGYYFKSGSFGMMEGVRKIISTSNIRIKLNSEVDALHVNTIDKVCKIILSNKKTYTYTNVVISSGTKIPNIYIDGDRWEWDVSEKIRIRPQLYLQVKDTPYLGIRQAILKNHEQIKYIHDITEYSKGLPDKSRLYVIALHKIGHGSERFVANVMKEIGIIESAARIEFAYAFSPLLSCYDAADLERLNEHTSGLVRTIYTENFTAAIGRLSDSWTNTLAKFG